MEIEVHKHVTRPMADVFAWCTELRQRRILVRTPEVIELEDRGILGPSFVARYRIRVHPPDRWEAHVTSKLGSRHDEYRLSPDSTGTRIDIGFDLHPRGPYRLIAPFYVGRLRRRLSSLWDDFAAAMESEI